MSGINQWLNENISKYDDATNKEYICNIFSILYLWLEENNKLVLIYNPSEILIYFYIFIYNKQLFEKRSCEIIDSYFTADIIDLYFDISEKYGTSLLEEKEITSDDLLIFLNHMTYFCEDNFNNEEEDLVDLEEIIM